MDDRVKLLHVLSVIVLTCQLQDLCDPHNQEKSERAAAEALERPPSDAPCQSLHSAPSVPHR